MSFSLRILIAADSADDARRVETLIGACGLALMQMEPARWDRVLGLIADPARFDVVVAVRPTDLAAVQRVLQKADEMRVQAVILVDELAAEVATMANRHGARVCLLSHGMEPLRAALLRAMRERTGEAARQSSHALIQENVSDVLFSLAVEGDRFRFVEINPAFTKATGLTEELVVGRLVDEVIPEPSLSLVLSKYREALAQRRTVRWEEVTPYPAGNKYGQVSVTPVVWADGRVSLLGTVHDVTDVRRGEETIRLYANVVDAVQIGLSVLRVPDPSDPRAITLIAANPAASQLAGVDLRERLGERLLDLFPTIEGTALVELVCDVARDGKTRELPKYRWHARTLAVKAFALSDHRVGLALEDVSARTRVNALRAAERKVLELVASNATLEETLTALVTAMEELAPPAIGSILLLTPDGRHVQHGAAPHLPDEYNRAVEGEPIGPVAGSCGTAMWRKKPVIVADIDTDPLWAAYREVASRFGLRACWSTPIMGSGDRVLGSFALYYRSPRAPDHDDLELIERATHIAGIAIQRHELDEQLRAFSARLDEVREEERTHIAREIHDQLGQLLTAIKMDLAWIMRRASGTGVMTLSNEALIEKLGDVSQLTDELTAQVRRIAADLRPALLDDIGLGVALSWRAEQFAARTNIACAVRSAIDDQALSRDVATTVYRIFEEALTNVARHAQARTVDAELEESGGALVLHVRDDGKGIQPQDIVNPHSLGLLGIRERARRLGGTASFARAEPSGTVVTLRLPLEATPPSTKPS
ncbi:MAG: sensor histidine kinase [Polyangiales bacterium]